MTLYSSDTQYNGNEIYLFNIQNQRTKVVFFHNRVISLR